MHLLKLWTPLSIFVILLSLCGSGKAICPTGWKKNFKSKSCYLIVNSNLDFDAANENCQLRNATLAMPDDQKEKDFLHNYLHDITAQSYMYWIGVQNENADGTTFQMINNIKISYDFGDVVAFKSPGVQEYCVGLRRDESNVKSCTQKAGSICEKPLVNCLPGWKPVNDDCVKLYTDLKTWDEAKAACTSIGASLLKYPGENSLFDYQLYLSEMSRSLGSIDIWNGLYVDADNRRMLWSDGSELTGFGSYYTQSIFLDSQKCGVSRLGSFIRYAEVNDCFSLRGFACNIDGSKRPTDSLPVTSPNACTDGFEIVADSCYSLSTGYMTWAAGKSYCAGKGATLIMANTDHKKAILDYILTYKIHDKVWLGINRAKDKDAFTWIDNSPVSSSITIHDPSRSTQGEHNCVYATHDPSGILFDTHVCSATFPALCVKAQDASAGPGTSTGGSSLSQGSCQDGWTERPGTDSCYIVYDEMRYPFTRANPICLSLNATLVSIQNKDEEGFLSDLLADKVSTTYWIGLRRRHFTKGWYWSDGTAASYFNWRAGEPSNRMDYFTTLQKADMKWFGESMTISAAFICERQINKKKTFYRTTPQPQKGRYYGCEKDWYSYENNCYLIEQKETVWSDASKACRRLGAQLASIHSDEEKNFIQSLLPKGCSDKFSSCQRWKNSGWCKNNTAFMQPGCSKSCGYCNQPCRNNYPETECEHWASIGECTKNPKFMWVDCMMSCGCDPGKNSGYWLGLNDKETYMDFKWIDRSEVKYTNWEINEPNNYRGRDEDCVLMHVISGAWSDVACDIKSTGYICKKKETFLAQKIEDPASTGCPAGSIGYLSKCYTFVTERLTWSDAKDHCEQDGKKLAVLSDRSTNAFVTAEIGNKIRDKWAWIGLSANGTIYGWVDGTPLTFTAFGFSHTATLKDLCVSGMRHGSWYAFTCLSKHPFVCQSDRKGYAIFRPSPLPTATSAPCPSRWTAFGNRCYRVVLQRQTFWDASKYCENYGGSLISIPDKEINDFVIDTLLPNSFSFRRFTIYALWIGLEADTKTRNFRWTDGTAFNFGTWEKGEPNNVDNSEHCVELVMSSRKWNDIECTQRAYFVCQTVRGGLFDPPTTPFVTPVEYCDIDGNKWRKFGRNCYHLKAGQRLSWFDARRECADMEADLVSIRSFKENVFIQSLASSDVKGRFWIGFHETSQGLYRWTDTSPQVYSNFRDGEPNDAFGEEKCVAMFAEDGTWSDKNCMINFQFICKRPKKGITAPTLPPPIKGKCPYGFWSEFFSNKCYYLGGLKDPKSWEDAHKLCKNRNANGELASVKNNVDLSFLKLMLEKSTSDVWIGMNTLPRGSWLWVDNSEVKFTFWGYYRPIKGNRRNCASMMRYNSHPQQIGAWDNRPCSEKKPYICQAPREPSTEESPKLFADQYNQAACGVDKSSYFKYHDRCFKVHRDMQTWESARQTCSQEDSELALTFDIFEVARLTYEFSDNKTGKLQFWIGVRFKEDKGLYVWNDEHRVRQTFWDLNEPDDQSDNSCVSVKKGLWADEDCSKELPFFCVLKGYDDIKPPTVGPNDGKCMNVVHSPHGDYCYFIPKRSKANWSDANKMCNDKGMYLASVHSEETEAFLTQLLQSTRSDVTNAWIGYSRGSDAAFRWSDDSADNFYHWDTNQPSSESEECVEMSSKNGRWNDVSCDAKLAFVCMVEKVFFTTTLQAESTLSSRATQSSGCSDCDDSSDKPQDSGESSQLVEDNDEKGGLSGGAVAGIVIGVLIACVLMVGVSFFFVRERLPQWRQHLALRNKLSGSVGFDNNLYKEEQAEGQSQSTSSVGFGEL